jgi:hypothetical protein
MPEDSAAKVVPIKPGVKVSRKKKKTRAYRSGADWETLEYYYRIGWSLKDIAALPEAKGITSQAISNRISRYKWTRNLEPRVADAARALMLNGDETPKQALRMLRGNSQIQDEVVLTAAAEVAERLKKIRARTKRLDSIIDRVADLMEGEIAHLELEAQDDSKRELVRLNLNRLTKSLGQLATTVGRANEEEHRNRNLAPLMKNKDTVKPLLVKKRAVLDQLDAGEDDDEGEV